MDESPLPCMYCASAIPDKPLGTRGRRRVDYCSTGCCTRHRTEQISRRRIAGKATDTKVCPVCATDVPPARPGDRGRARIFCSKRCGSKAVAARKRLREVAERTSAGCTCETCGESLATRRRDTRFCSVWCADVARGARRAEPFPFAICALDGCDIEFQLKKTGQRACSEPHGKKLWHQEHPGAGVWTDKRRDAYHRRRAQKKATANDRPVLLSEIRERDGNRCHLCRKLVSVKPYPHPLSASLDHVIPLSLDGEHVPENVRLAHLRCNVERGNRGGNEQLLLIG